MSGRIIAWVALILLIGGCMRSELSWQRRKLEHELREVIDNPRRFVDVGVELRVVVADPDGAELLDGKPPLRILRAHRFGGMLDTQANPPRLVGPSRERTIWYCSIEQEPVILHGDGVELGMLVEGSEGAGKTTCLPMWHYCRWIEHLGEYREGGQTAPTETRLDMFATELRRLYPAGWYTMRVADRQIVLVDGTRIQMVSTHRQSAAQGSPVQGFSWSWCGRDEAQDQIEAHGDIESRGRAARNGRYKQLATSTVKNDAAYRSLRDKLLTSGVWARRQMLGPSSPFIWPRFWDDKKATMSAREYARRVLAQDMTPELSVYYGWSRGKNLVAKPQIGLDVTASVLANYSSYTRPGARFTVLVGHDPGNIYDTSTVAKLYMFSGVPTWVVVGEIQTKQTTAAQHARALKAYLQTTCGVEYGDGSKAAIFVDPHGKGEGQTDYQTVYMAFQKESLDVFTPAALTGRIKRSARVAMINRLFCAADESVRLVVGCDEHRQPLAPVLVDALESLQKKEGDDDPEGSQRKDAADKTHAPAALAYSLWAFEQEAITDTTQRIAKNEARRIG